MISYETPAIITSYFVPALYCGASGFASSALGDQDDCAPGDFGGSGASINPFARNC